MRSTGSVNIIVAALITVEGGEFLMGNDRERPDERPTHRVSVEAFRVAFAPVTNAEYGRFVDQPAHEPSRFAGDPLFNAPLQPVVGVNWFDAVAYCDWLSTKDKTRFRLPTEAERERAALGGIEAADWPWVDGRHALADIIGSLDQPHVPEPACENGYGLRCMAENVHEWCSDWYDAGYYACSPVRAPAGPASGRRRSSRGGSWRHAIKFTRITARASLDPGFRYNDFGFRVYADAR